ncbi:hypothetical protein IEQ34_001962 [Dendrobium chrysotoxum]|uniref:ribonuclease Z n=1 Tax=Dendrobium chrysotoxum TaxID=161865 RepID=A0AAV7HKM5_DENCH|nr:hypothetical protein IEQ34_001962 [Dendrobium chrysotoxum]
MKAKKLNLCRFCCGIERESKEFCCLVLLLAFLVGDGGDEKGFHLINFKEMGGGQRRHTIEASMDAVLSSHGLSEDCFAEVEEKGNRAKGSKPQLLETTLFGLGSKMQSYWKRPGSPVDMATIMPVLRRLKKLIHKADSEALYSVPVIHCPHASAFVLKATERINSVGNVIPGWKLVYSGDTRPCQSLININGIKIS